jgi:hypothetical protein
VLTLISLTSLGLTKHHVDPARARTGFADASDGPAQDPERKKKVSQAKLCDCLWIRI